MTVVHNGIRYHDEDAKARGITADKAQRGPANDKAERPTKTKGARRGGRAAGTDSDAPATREP